MNSSQVHYAGLWQRQTVFLTKMDTGMSFGKLITSDVSAFWWTRGSVKRVALRCSSSMREVNALDPVDRSRLVVLLGVDGLREDDGRWIRLDWLGVVTRADSLALVESLGLYDTIKAEMISELALWDLDLVEELVSDWDFSVDGAVALLESGVKSEPDAADPLKLKWSVGNRSEHRVNPQLFSSGLQQLWAGAMRTHIQMDDGLPLQERVQKAMAWQVRAIFS